jgi:hypothetical protein
LPGRVLSRGRPSRTCRSGAVAQARVVDAAAACVRFTEHRRLRSYDPTILRIQTIQRPCRRCRAVTIRTGSPPSRASRHGADPYPALSRAGPARALGEPTALRTCLEGIPGIREIIVFRRHGPAPDGTGSWVDSAGRAMRGVQTRGPWPEAGRPCLTGPGPTGPVKSRG